MLFRFLLSDPNGDIALSPEDLKQPFLTGPSEKHPFLTLKDYFGALQAFATLDDSRLLLQALEKQDLQDTHSLADFREVLIRSEKHGAFYHIASLELSGPGKKCKFAVTTALSGPAKASLVEEFSILQKLASLHPDFLPQVFCREAVAWETDSGAAEFLMVLGEWLDSYHEWHISGAPGANRQEIQLWDYAAGYRFLSDAESYELLRQAAYILTYYYDQASFCQIYPWHHGAGDFVIKADHGALSVKLITARQYEPLVHFDGQEETDRLVAAIQFLLNLCLRMRLDRRDGVGGPAWLDDFAVPAAVEGFFAGLSATAATNRFMLGSVADFLEIMQSFDSREIFDMYESLLEIYAEEDQDDFRLIQARLSAHAEKLHEALQNYSLPEPQGL